MFQTASLTHTGERPVNEDYVGFIEHSTSGCWVVADGLGGHGGGEIASRLAVETVLSVFRPKIVCKTSVLQDSILDANRAIVEKQQLVPEAAMMRSTIVVLLAGEGCAVWGHLGDSRLYRFRGHQLLTHTRDHSVPQALYDAGEIQASEIRHHEDRGKVLRCLGSKVPPRATISVGDPLMANDRFLLCTDGFWESVTEDEIKRDLESADSAGEWLDSLAMRVRARATPQQDNYSAIAVWGSA